MNVALLDTDILSELLKQQNQYVTRQAAAYLNQHGQFAFSAFTRFEIMRGFREKNAQSQLVRFGLFCQHALVIPVTEDIFDRAADLWVMARQGGYSCGDADLLIAATALDQQRSLVTGNLNHFAWIPNLNVEDWRVP